MRKPPFLIACMLLTLLVSCNREKNERAAAAAEKATYLAKLSSLTSTLNSAMVDSSQGYASYLRISVMVSNDAPYLKNRLHDIAKEAGHDIEPALKLQEQLEAEIKKLPKCPPDCQRLFDSFIELWTAYDEMITDYRALWLGNVAVIPVEKEARQSQRCDDAARKLQMLLIDAQK